MSDDHNYHELPEDFSPSDSDVICGWARQNYHHAGNQMLRDVILKNVPKYVKAKSKTDKGKVIIEIVENIRRNSPSGVGLVKQNPKTGRWSFIGVEKAKDKIGHALRKASQEGSRQSKKKSLKSKLGRVPSCGDGHPGVAPPSPGSPAKTVSYDEGSKQGSRPPYSAYHGEHAQATYPPPPHMHPQYPYHPMYPPPPPPPPGYPGYHYGGHHPGYPYYPPPPPPHLVPQYEHHAPMPHAHKHVESAGRAIYSAVGDDR